MRRSSANVAFAAVSLVVTLAAFALAQRGDVAHQSFKAFYCAGVAVRERHDPYRVEPLRTCERRLERGPMPSGYVEPAPLPGYALVGFAALSTLPPRLAAELFAVILALAAVAGARCLATTMPASGTAILLAFTPLTLLNVAYGETAPLALLAICAAAYFLATQRWVAAGCAVCLALVQPNVGVVAVAAILLFVPRSRASVLVTGAVLATISLVGLGVAQNEEYFTRVLPMLANAELVASDQYSLSRLLYVAGASPSVALLLGKVWFACAACFGIALAGAFAARCRQDILVPLLPPAAVLLFGIYLHDVQILIAVPAALVIALRAPRGWFRAFATMALALLIAVWTQRAARATVIFDLAGVFGGVFAVLRGATLQRVAVAAIGAVATTACVVLLVHIQPPPTAGQILTHAFSAAPDEFSPAAWARYLRATAALTRETFAPQLAAWLGLLGLLAAAVATGVDALRRRPADATMPSRS